MEFETLDWKEAARAWANGDTIQYHNGSEFYNDKYWNDMEGDRIEFEEYRNYRIKPQFECELPAWTREDVPNICWIRKCADNQVNLITGINDHNIRFGSNCCSFEYIKDKFVYSTDLKEWWPCHKSVLNKNK